ncbi:hypothetical protein SNEBB_010946 [Seison nebaliae]|nr:hypothetical protein SNEBB_010946 [Seison nebaliae]
MMIVLGSGGHTTEMLKIMKGFNKDKYSPRHYVVADSDINSQEKCLEFENEFSDYEIISIPRSRKVFQSYFTSFFTTIYAILYVIPLIYYSQPKIFLSNGPGTAIPLVFIVNLLRFFRIIRKCEIIFVESFARVHTLSLTGKLMYYLFAHYTIVQWEELRRNYKKSKYLGRLL